MTPNKPLISWKTLPPVMVIIQTNFHLKLFVSLVKRKMIKLNLLSQPKFAITMLVGCSCNCNDRKRRSTLEETSRTLYYIRAGPFTFVDADGEEKQG